VAIHDKTLIGRRELVNFPELKLFGIQAKIDTGAYTTALHCYDIYEMREGKEKVLCFKTLDPSYHQFDTEEIQIRKYSRKKIKNSSGAFEKRFIIKTPITIGGLTFETDISLTDRSNMRYPVLLGRKVLAKGFIIDVTKTNVTTRKKKAIKGSPNKK
jgi:hypothetical protein